MAGNQARRRKAPTRDILEIPVLGHTFTIEESTTLSEGVYGETLGHERKIHIRAGLSDEDRHSTIIHEIIHAVFHITGWTDKLDAEEEGLVMALEHGLSPLVQLKEQTGDTSGK